MKIIKIIISMIMNLFFSFLALLEIGSLKLIILISDIMTKLRIYYRTLITKIKEKYKNRKRLEDL